MKLLLALLLVCASTLTPLVAAQAQVPTDMGSTIARGVEILLARQETDEHIELEVDEPIPDDQDLEDRREWPYQGVHRVGGNIPWGYRIGGTSIACTALLAAPGHDKNNESQAAVARGLEFVLEALAEHGMGSGFSRSYDVRGWGHTYALAFLLDLRKRQLVDADAMPEVDRVVSWLLTTLEETQLTGGGWNYSRPNGDASQASPFQTAPTLLALYEAEAQGEHVSHDMVMKALDALDASRGKDGSYPYTARKSRRDQMPGATGRSPAVEVALTLAGRGDTERMRVAVEGFLEHWQFLEDRRRKSGTHKPPHQIAPYYFFYAHRYVAMAIEFLPDAERPALRARFYERLFQVQEKSGGWNDRVFDRSENFGTAMSVLALLEPSSERPTAWPAARKQAPDLTRVHVLGASVSAGYGTRRAFGAHVNLGDVLQVCLGDSSTVTQSSTDRMFINPVDSGGAQMDTALDTEPQLLVGVDFLFWYAYGIQDNAEARIERFEEGLDALDEFEGLIIVGDLPDCTYAIPGGMINERMIPALATQKLLNVRLREWALERGNTYVIPFEEFLADIPTKKFVEVRGTRYMEPFARLFQRDRLHATIPGTIAVVRMALSCLPDIDSLKTITWDDDTVLRRVEKKFGVKSRRKRKPVPARDR